MRNITFKKMKLKEIEVLLELIQDYISYTKSMLNNSEKGSTVYISYLLVHDILEKLFYAFRNKIEKTPATKPNITFSISVSESVILLNCCNHKFNNCSEYEKFIKNKYLEIIHKSLINI